MRRSYNQSWSARKAAGDGGGCAEAGQSEEAERLYRQGLGIRQGLAEAEPGNTTYRRDLSLSYERLGVLAEPAAASASWFEQAGPQTWLIMSIRSPRVGCSVCPNVCPNQRDLAGRARTDCHKEDGGRRLCSR